MQDPGPKVIERLDFMMPVPEDSVAFTDAMSDLLRLPDETVAMSYIYLNKYRRYQDSSGSPDPLDAYVGLPFQLSMRTSSASVIPLQPLIKLQIPRRWH